MLSRLLINCSIRTMEILLCKLNFQSLTPSDQPEKVCTVFTILTFLQLTNLFSETQQNLEERTAELSETNRQLSSTRVALTSTRQDLYHTTKEKEERGFLVEEHSKTERVLLGEAEQVHMVKKNFFFWKSKKGLCNEINLQDINFEDCLLIS